MNKSNFAVVITLLVALVVSSGCAKEGENLSPMPSISDDAKASIKSPVNCATAKKDIQTLEDERASVGRRVLAGVRSVLPIAAVVGILTNDYNDRVEVATGDYNAALEAKIRQIRATCYQR